MDGDKKIADVNKETAKGVTELLASNPTYEGASGRTTNYSLPLYERGDNFKILTDQNIAMSIIDTALADNDGEFDSLKNKVATVEANIRQLGNSLENTNSTVAALLSRLSDVEEAVEDIPTIKDDLIAQNNLIKTLTNRVLTLENGKNGMQRDIDSNTGNIATLRNEVSTIKNNIDSHDTELERIRNKVKAGYAFKDNVTSNTTLSTTVYSGNTIESSKYLVTVTGSIKNAINQTGYFKQWVYDGTSFKGVSNISHVSYNTKDASAYIGDSLGVSVNAQKNTGQGLMTITANINMSSGPWCLTMTAIPVY